MNPAPGLWAEDGLGLASCVGAGKRIGLKKTWARG